MGARVLISETWYKKRAISSACSLSRSCFGQLAYARDRWATLHGVVFDILGARAVALAWLCHPGENSSIKP
jgi:hypothetical protein